MLIVAIVGILFTALAFSTLWLDLRDPHELYDMGVNINYSV